MVKEILEIAGGDAGYFCVSGMDISYRVEVPNTLYSREY